MVSYCGFKLDEAAKAQHPDMLPFIWDTLVELSHELNGRGMTSGEIRKRLSQRFGCPKQESSYYIRLAMRQSLLYLSPRSHTYFITQGALKMFPIDEKIILAREPCHPTNSEGRPTSSGPPFENIFNKSEGKP